MISYDIIYKEHPLDPQENTYKIVFTHIPKEWIKRMSFSKTLQSNPYQKPKVIMHGCISENSSCTETLAISDICARSAKQVQALRNNAEFLRSKLPYAFNDNLELRLPCLQDHMETKENKLSGIHFDESKTQQETKKTLEEIIYQKITLWCFLCANNSELAPIESTAIAEPANQ